MTDPVTFASTTPRHGLPVLFPGQAQKEVTLNEALARIDALVHPAVQGIADAPPADPGEGESWLVSTTPSGAWSGEAETLATYQSGNWLFMAPVPGMKVFDVHSGVQWIFADRWQRSNPIAAPSGGTSADTQARAAIVELIAALELAGVLPAA